MGPAGEPPGRLRLKLGMEAEPGEVVGGPRAAGVLLEPGRPLGLRWGSLAGRSAVGLVCAHLGSNDIVTAFWADTLPHGVGVTLGPFVPWGQQVAPSQGGQRWEERAGVSPGAAEPWDSGLSRAPWPARASGRAGPAWPTWTRASGCASDAQRLSPLPSPRGPLVSRAAVGMDPEPLQAQRTCVPGVALVLSGSRRTWSSCR